MTDTSPVYPQTELPEGRDYDYAGDLLTRRDIQARLATRFLKLAENHPPIAVLPLHHAEKTVRCFHIDFAANWACNNHTYFLVMDMDETSEVVVPACMEHLGYAVVYAQSVPWQVRERQ